MKTKSMKKTKSKMKSKSRTAATAGRPDAGVLRKRARDIVRLLAKEYPDAECALHHENPLQLLIATILSAQCTDVRVNMVTPALSERFKTARDFAEAEPAELERMIQSTGFFRAKTRSIQACCRQLVEQHGGLV